MIINVIAISRLRYNNNRLLAPSFHDDCKLGYGLIPTILIIANSLPVNRRRIDVEKSVVKNFVDFRI